MSSSVLAPLMLILAATWLVASSGCGQKEQVEDPAPFLQAVTVYLQKNDMALKVKTIRSGPTVKENQAQMTAALTHAELGGPAVTWELQFVRQSDGTWQVTSHTVK